MSNNSYQKNLCEENKIQNFNQYEDHLDDIINQYKSRI